MHNLCYRLILTALLHLEQRLYITTVKPLWIAYISCQSFLFYNEQTLPSHVAIYTSTVDVQMCWLCGTGHKISHYLTPLMCSDGGPDENMRHTSWSMIN